MSEVIIFGGTTEGRELAAYCGRVWIPTTVCVATALGDEVSAHAPSVSYHVGPMDLGEITAFLRDDRPKVVVDATHPYATAVTANIAAATTALGLPLIRVARPDSDRQVPGADAVRRVPDMDALIALLNTTEGTVFATTGLKEARALTGVEGFADRVYLRLLPLADGLAECAALGYPAAHLIAMYGPFSEELNAAMFKQTGAAILVTKDSGFAGGLPQKLRAAAACGMTTVMLDRPEDTGVSLEDAYELLAKALR